MTSIVQSIFPTFFINHITGKNTEKSRNILRAIPENNISAGGCLKVWGLHVKYYFCGGKWQTMCGVAQSLCEAEKTKFLGGNTKISGKYKNIGEASISCSLYVDGPTFWCDRYIDCEYLKKGT